MAATKYGKCITTTSFFKPENQVEGVQAAWLAGGRMGNHLKGINLTITYASFNEPGPMGFIPNGPHVHDFDEVQLFLGGEMNDISRLGGEVEVSLGKEEEKHIIGAPSAIAVPKGMPHLPATIKRVYKPFYFMTISLTPGIEFSRAP